MLAVEEARARILDTVRPVHEAERVPVAEAAGRYLAEPARARVPSPAFDNSAMDGYALKVADLGPAGGELPVALTVAAGDPPSELPAGACARIMTGAPVPAGADAVVMQENVERTGEQAGFSARPPLGDNIRHAGEDLAPGDLLAEAGERVTPFLVSALATAGLDRVAVVPRPRVYVLSTGSELRDAGVALEPGQIHDSNRPALVAELRRLGVDVVDGGRVPDDPDALREAFRAAAGCDFVVTSGGVSVGEFDQVKAILEEQGEVGLWKVAIKPGKPLAFGRLGQAHFFGLPGNPVSALVTFRQFVQPALVRWQGGGYTPTRIAALAGGAFERRQAARTEFLRARLHWEAGRLIATPLSRQGSGMIGGLSRAHGFIVLEAGSHGFEAGDSLVVEPTGEWCSFGEPQPRGEQ